MKDITTKEVNGVTYKVPIDTEKDVLLGFRTKKEIYGGATINDLDEVEYKSTEIRYYMYVGNKENYYYEYNKITEPKGKVTENIHSWTYLSTILKEFILNPQKWTITEEGRLLVHKVEDL